MTDWAVPHSSKLKYSQIFNSNDNQRSGLLTGVQARNILIQSGLSQQILAQIWFLSDCDKDGMLTCEEFILAMHLIDRCKQNIPLPTTLPPELIPPEIKRKLSIVSPTLSLDKTAAKEVKPSSIPVQVTKPIEIQPPLIEWNIPQASKLKYTQLFNQTDVQRNGLLTGIQARNILVKSGLSNQHLANIWNLSDIDKDGNLTCEEFILSMHLIDMVKSGDNLPIQLPIELIPLSYRKKQSLNGIPSSQLPQHQQPQLSNQSSVESIGNRNTFEDKRKENFEKGQAELEKRRQLLMEQQKREQEERERKEKEEFEKRERIRLEQERKKKEEMERQLQKQREIEMQKEEERKKQQELKEAARREMERQRMIEWENQKKSEMQSTKQRVQEALINLKAKKQRMIVDVEQVNSQLNGLKEKVEETREKVSEAKQEIDKMRISRDTKLKEMNLLKNQIRTLHERHLIIEQEKLNLATQLKNLNLNLVETNKITDSADFAVKSKQIRIEQLKEQLIENEKEKELKEKDIEVHKAELEKFKTQYEEILERTNELQRIYDDKRKEALEAIEKQIRLAEEASRSAFDFNANWGEPTIETEQLQDNNNLSTGSGLIKYRALYEFEGQNPDDLSFNAGDIINSTVNTNQEDSDWLHGELNGKTGYFPKTFCEIIQDSGSLNISSSVNESISVNNSSIPLTAAPTSTTTASPLVDTYVQVLYDWQGTDSENHLSIKKDDKVKVLEDNDDWLLGELNGLTGWLPKSYVSFESSAEWYISSFAFETQEEGDLAFEINELVHVTKKDSQWWTGEIGETRKGVFPCTFVREATEQELIAAGKIAPKQEQESTPNKQQVQPATKDVSVSESVEHTPSRSSETSKSKKAKASKKPEIVQAIANYKATGKEQLELKKGQMIQVRKRLESGWCFGEIQVKGKNKQMGYFPSAYVKTIGGKSGVTDESVNSAPRSPSISKQPEEEKIEKVITLYAYEAQQEDELSFNSNEIIKIIDKSDQTWYKGESEVNGKIGIFPSNYCQPYRGYNQFDDFQSDFTESINYQESVTTSNMDWDNSSFDDSYDDDEDYDSFLSSNNFSENGFNNFEFVESNIKLNSTNNHLIKKELTKEEILFKRQQNIEELILTENDYINDLKIVIEVYKIEILNSPYLNKQLADTIFLNWDSLLDCNQKFLNDLIKRRLEYNNNLIERIGDILNFYFQNEMGDKYVKFCSNQLKSMSFYNQQMETNSEFKNQIILCNNLNKNKLKLKDFTSYILCPMQRITRYILLTKEILKRTPLDHIDYQRCYESYDSAQRLCELVNASCHSAENEERLNWIQTHLNSRLNIDQRIKYNSLTKFMGPRTLIYYGRLKNDSKNKVLLGLLFNDFFIMAKSVDKHKRIPKYSNLFSSKEALDSKYKIYKRPFMLDDIEVILNSSQLNDESAPNLICMLNKKGEFRPNLKFFVIKIHSVKKYFYLRAYDGYQRKSFINNLQKSIEEYRIKKSFYYDKSLNNLMHNFDCNIKIGNLSLIIIKLNNFKTRNYVLNAFCCVSIGNFNLVQDDHDILFKSKCAKFKLNSENTFDAVFNFSSKFLLSQQMIDNDYLTITCIEESPFSPNCMIGKSEIKLDILFEELNLNKNSIYKKIKFDSFGNSQPNCDLQLKFQAN